MIRNVGIIGSGTMGSGIAQVCAQNGYKVKIYDISTEQLNRSMSTIRASLEKRVVKGKLSDTELNETMANLEVTLEIDALAESDLTVEAIFEDVDKKREIFLNLERVCREDAILATNTSSLSIIEIASTIKKSERVVGIHFFNPAPAMKLVEIVKSLVTSEETVNIASEFAKSLGKEIIMSKDTPGFIVNYLQYPFRLNAIRMLERGMATAEEIDRAATLGLGHPMGPLALQDMVGLDITYNAVSSIYEETKDPAMAPPVLMKRMVEAGLLGRKTGKGFYEY